MSLWQARSDWDVSVKTPLLVSKWLIYKFRRPVTYRYFSLSPTVNLQPLKEHKNIMITLVCEQICFSAQKQTFTSSKALNSLSLTLIHSPTLPIPFINSICTSFTFNSGSARTMIAWAEREHENGHIFISCSTRCIYLCFVKLFEPKERSEEQRKNQPWWRSSTEIDIVLWLVVYEFCIFPRK